MFTPLVAEYLFCPAVRLPKLILARDVTGFVLVSLPVTLICTSATTVINATPVLLLVCAPVIPPLSNNIMKAVIATTTASKIVTVFVPSSTIVHLLLYIRSLISFFCTCFIVHFIASEQLAQSRNHRPLHSFQSHTLQHDP